MRTTLLSPSSPRRVLLTKDDELSEIIARVAPWAGGIEAAEAWARSQPIAAFGGRTAESLVKSGKAEAVRDYLEFIAAGGFA